MTTHIIEDLLISAQAAADNIQRDAEERGFTGDIEDAPAVLDFLANCPMDIEDYALLYANSAIIETCCRTVARFGNEDEQAEAAKWERFDYVNN